MENKLRDLIDGTGFRFNKALGQNFISDVNLLNGIVSDSGLEPSDTVVEIGTGAGTLTRCLASQAEKVYSFEVDKNLEPVVSLSLQGLENVEVVFKDVLKMSDTELLQIVGEKPFRVVANLPYYITTPLIMRFLESELPIVSLTVMVQEEVGKRLVAKANTPDYAAITLAVELRGNAKITRKVGRQMFFPSPNVDSAVVRIDVEPDKLRGENIPLLKRVIRSAFAMRRKTLANNLSASFSISKSAAEEKLSTAGLPPMIRGEALSLDDFVLLTRQFDN